LVPGRLELEELSIATAALHELLVVSGFHDASCVQHIDAIGHPNGREAM
jgi:hypothetical protein